MPSFRAQSRNPPCPFRGRLPILLCHTYDAIPVCKKDRGLRSGWRCVNGVFQIYPLYATWNKPIPPIPSFRAQREIFLALCSFLLLSQKFSPFPLSHIRRYIGVQERSLGFARDDDTGIALSQHILYTMRRISPYDPQQKSPSQSWSFFCVRKTYLPNCASMVPAATAVPITPATFGPIACISR